MILDSEGSIEIINKVYENEKEFVDLFSSSFNIQVGDLTITRFHDDGLRDMYDHNFFQLDYIDEEIFSNLLKIKNDRSENFVKIFSDKPLDFLKEKEFELCGVITMLKEDYLDFPIPHNYLIEYKNVRENEDIINDVIANEIIYYGKEYGIDFCIRRWNHYFNKIKEGENGLNIFACYHQNKYIGSCYAYYHNGVVCVDALLVVEEYRKQYVASNLLRYIAHFYNCPIYLHTEEEGTPKEMYLKLGFKPIAKFYDYLLLDKEK